ncbi:hypothetical protein AAFC00_001425 [Neodothiora populina]|uniref:RING-CH-type domain-containing protein n=1 Tax=Neodothiora populina TaxID=2781224 RepID=A0ABR3PNW6_9PEZI
MSSSMQPRPTSQRRPSPEHTSDSHAQSQPEPRRPRSQSQANSAASSEDSQTVVVNTSSILKEREEASSSLIAPAAAPPHADEEDVKKCWICFSDETEDTPETSEWRDPCPCALVAHEDCLLDWIADMESPSSRKRSLSPPRPVCPQCKTDVYLARPKNYIVESIKALERVSAKVTTPGILMLAFSTIVNACEAHGRYTIFTIFGPEDGLRIMRPVLDDIAHPHQVRNWLDVKTVFNDLLRHWRLRVGLPLITPLLVLSRTHFADSLLPVLPIVFFATQGDTDEPLDFASWPPSASLAMAVLPYLRGAYNAYYERVWAEKERRWLKEIQPRNGRDTADDAANAAQNNRMNDDLNDHLAPGENNFEVRIDAGIWEDWGNAGAVPEAQQQQVAHPFNAPPLADDGPHQQPPQQQQQRIPQQPPAPPVQPAQAENRQERLLSLNTTALAEKLLGALFFPTIASATGELLSVLLPQSWVTKPAAATVTSNLFGRKPAPTGLLQEKWGRSIVGGCLFVVVKDAVMLYVRWKMAMQHRRRRVLDYDRVKKRVVR